MWYMVIEEESQKAQFERIVDSEKPSRLVGVY